MDKTFSLKFDLRIVCVILLVIVAGMLLLWRPWETKDTRKVSIAGQAEVQAVPDEFIFRPTFERTGADSAKLKDELNTFGNQLQAKLKELGVAENDIKLDSSSYDKVLLERQEQTVSLTATITVPDQMLAQKVQDYLASTDAEGQLTAQAHFSDNKRRELENQARDKAIEDARAKAERSAQKLGANLGKVIEAKDVAGFDLPIYGRGGLEIQADTSLPVTPGTDTVIFRVEVVFELR